MIEKRYQMKDISRNEITNSQREKDSNKQTKPSTLSMMAQSTKTKRFVFPRDMSSGSNTNLKQIKQQLKTNNVLKHIGQLPQDLCIIYDLAFEYKMHTNGIITLHIYYSNKGHVQERVIISNTNLKNSVLLKVGQLPQEQCIIQKYDFE